MAIVLFMVRAKVEPVREDAFNHWYDTEHVPQVLRYPGAVSARRYKQILGDDTFEYMALYEFASEETFAAFHTSEHLAELIREYDARFGDCSDRRRSAFVQVFPR